MMMMSDSQKRMAEALDRALKNIEEMPDEELRRRLESITEEQAKPFAGLEKMLFGDTVEGWKLVGVDEDKPPLHVSMSSKVTENMCPVCGDVGEEEMGEWELFFKEHQDVILGWLARFAPKQENQIKTLLNTTPLDTQAAYDILNQAWADCPDSRSIRTEGFFRLCDLLDGTVEL